MQKIKSKGKSLFLVSKLSLATASICYSDVVEFDASGASLVTFTHTGEDVRFSSDGILWLFAPIGQIALESEVGETELFAYNSVSGTAFFQSSNFSWDDTISAPHYWEFGSYTNGAVSGINYLLIDVDGNSVFETLVELTIPSNPGLLPDGDPSIYVSRYFYDLDANNGTQGIDIEAALADESVPTIEVATNENGDFILNFAGILQSSENLSSWQDVEPQPISPVVFDRETLSTMKFYRTRSE